MPDIEIEDIGGRGYAIYKISTKALLNVVRANIVDGHFSIDVRDYLRNTLREGEKIPIQNFEELEKKLYLKATEVSCNRMHSIEN